MKPSVILLGSAVASTIAYNAYSLTCGAQPSCSSLGYTYTGSTTDCVGPALKCPFNSSYFNCTKKSDVANAVMPNYANRLYRSGNVTYTAATAGYLIGIDYLDGSQGCGVSIIIDGINVRLEGQQTDWSRNSWTYPVRKGSSYNVNLSNCSLIYYFVPLS